MNSQTRTPRIEVAPVFLHDLHEKPGKHYWRLVGGNGETICHSQPYSNRSNARRAAKRLAGIVAAAKVVDA